MHTSKDAVKTALINLEMEECAKQLDQRPNNAAVMDAQIVKACSSDNIQISSQGISWSTVRTSNFHEKTATLRNHQHHALTSVHYNIGLKNFLEL